MGSGFLKIILEGHKQNPASLARCVQLGLTLEINEENHEKDPSCHNRSGNDRNRRFC